MPQKKPKEQPAGAPAWMLTYGDMVTLMLCFFVLLFSMSTTDVVRFREILESFKGAYGPLEVDAESPVGQGPVDVKKPVDETKQEEPKIKAALEEIKKIKNELNEKSGTESEMEAIAAMEAIREQIESALQEDSKEQGQSEGQTDGQTEGQESQQGSEPSVQVVVEERGVIIRFQDDVLFDLGKAAIRDEGQRILSKVAQVLAGLSSQIRVEGHTDDIPIGWSLRGKYPTNWELSTARATTVLRYLIDAASLSPELMSASGYGEYRKLPKKDNENLDEYRQRLRRVDIVILDSSSQEPQINQSTELP